MPVLRQPAYRPQPVVWNTEAMPPEDLDLSLPREKKEQVPFGQSQDGYEAGYRDGFMAGQQEGYRQGYAAAEREWRKEQEQLQQQFQRSLLALQKAAHDEVVAFLARAEEAMTELAIEIAQKVVEAEITTNPDIVRRAVAQALQTLKGTTITVRVNPADFPFLGNNLNLLKNEEQSGMTVRFVPDESVERGGIIAESDQGVVDLQPQTKLALLRTEVL